MSAWSVPALARELGVDHAGEFRVALALRQGRLAGLVHRFSSTDMFEYYPQYELPDDPAQRAELYAACRALCAIAPGLGA